jgi:hypothetical protein
LAMLIKTFVMQVRTMHALDHRNILKFYAWWGSWLLCCNAAVIILQKNPSRYVPILGLLNSSRHCNPLSCSDATQSSAAAM